MDLSKRMTDTQRNTGEEKRAEAVLLDLRKAYPSINKSTLWRILERKGMTGNIRNVIEDLHEATVYKVRGQGNDSEPWQPERELREGCSTSPILFNIYHQAVMRIEEKKRREKADQRNMEAGVKWKWVPGSSFQAPEGGRRKTARRSKWK